MEKFRIDEITINLDNLRKPLNSQQRKEMSKKKLYPYYGANNLMDYIDEYIFDEEILCVAEDGGSWGYKEKCSYIVNEKCWVNNHAHILKAKKNINLKYLMYYLNYNDLSNRITGTTRGKLTKSALNSIEVKLPSIEKQKKIVALLEKAQELIDKRKKQIEELDLLVKSKFIEMFGDPVINPKGWKYPKIEEVVANKKNAIKAGPFGSALKKEYYIKSGYKIYGQEQVISGDINLGDYYISEEKYKELENYAIKSNDVLISLVGTYGKLLIVPTIFEAGIINPRLMKITFNSNLINTIYFKFFFQSESLRNRLSDNTHGGTMPILNVGIVRNINIPIPPIELQNQFADFVKQVDKLKFKMEKSLKELEENFNSLMQKIFKVDLL
ncbi:MAG: restriction endonuclease subunit S [Clostridium perfringens]|uniref:restriction endonuclease subunit S n=1 Tax=Clostridium perfringens TaxID=1502 RepID=UPI0013E28E68|nr:restriction endonuclease subunit S [Clostridium perfringens]ELC8354478.1 restriction endonuclease subunit S [Clostridium perfringens]MBI5993629.1 restriction endonuclease subunit S [Clostridium perfringens]MDK0838062.1 restriction endonuclease subunit S [Clostridium perfringens]MDK0906727.1 restriction endonuclease subunit S [Clostridium perfringens]MDU2779897.1 restriction endonuclease subunit S [Clostridium perfringens]